MRLHLLAAALPALLCSAGWIESNSQCFVLYQAKCCAIGDGTPNSGFTPGKQTRCVDSNLGSPWVCPSVNPGLFGSDVDDSVMQHTDCSKGGVGCQLEWRVKEDTTKKCKASRYRCSKVVHGHCDPNPTTEEWTCKEEEVFGPDCTKFKADQADQSGPAGH